MSSGSVVVVGAGLAGLACAWKLRRAGHEVEVLEREGEPGGRWRPELRDGFALEQRDPLCWSGDANLLASLRVLGLGSRLRPLPVSQVGVWEEAGLRDLPLGRRSAPLAWLAGLPPRALLPVLREAVLRGRRVRPAWPETAEGLDDASLAAWGRRALGDDGSGRWLAPRARLGLGEEPEQVSRGHALLQLRRLLGAGRPLSLEGGLDALLEGLRAGVGVRTGCEVLEVETQAAGARLRYRSRGREHRVLADAAVLAVPAAEVLRLAPKLAPGERGFFAAVECRPRLGIFLLLDRAPAGIRHYSVCTARGPGDAVLGLEAAHLRPGVAPPGAGLLRVRFSAAAARELGEAPDAAVLERGFEALRRGPWWVPETTRAVVWRDPLGAPRFGVGALRRLARFASRAERSPRLAFAGDGLLGPGVEAALTRGMRAATEVARLP